MTSISKCDIIQINQVDFWRIKMKYRNTKKRKCSDCISAKNGECSGLGNPCRDYREAYVIQPDRVDKFPKHGDAEIISGKAKGHYN